MVVQIRLGRTLSAVLSLLIFFVAGCGSSPTVGSVNISFTSSTVGVGGTLQLHATDVNSLHMTSDVTSTATWTSSNAAIATVNSSGLVTGVAAGSVTIHAASDHDSGSAVVTVTGATVTGITLAPSSATVYLGGGQQYSAATNSSNGTATDVTATTTWSVSPTSVATINSKGLLTAVAAGSFTVTGVSGGQTGTTTGKVVPLALASIAVTPATVTVSGGNTQQFAASGTYNNGSVRDLSNTVTWTSSNTAALTINASGLATIPDTSTSTSVTVTATQATSSGSIVGSAAVQIKASASVVSLVVQPTSSSIATGSAEQHNATAYYSDGTQKDVTNSVTWSSSDSSTTAVNDTGMNTAKTPGTTTLKASIPTNAAASPTIKPNVRPGATGANRTATPKADTATVSSSTVVIVTDATVTGLDISSSEHLFPVGSTQPIQLIGTFSDDTTQDLSLTANWTSSNPAIATIDSTGLAKGISAGAVTFSASFGGLTVSTVGFEVLPTTLIAGTIAVDFPAQLSGLPEQLRFIGTYSDGSTHDLTSLATFVSQDPSIFATSTSGVAYGVGSGSTQITGTALGFNAIIQLAAYKDPVNGLQVFPAVPRFALGTHLPFTSVVFATDPTTGVFFQDVSKPSLWVSSDPSILTIDSNGVAKAGKVGTTTVSASLLGVTAISDTVTVTNATLKRMTISQTLDTLAASTGQNYTATGFFNDGSVQDITQDVIWNTTDDTIASIDKNGLGLGIKAGQVQVTASFQGQTASTPLTVTSATLASIALLPGDAELPINVYHQYALIGTFSDGTTEDLTYGAVFLSPTPGIVAVYPQGLATGTFPGIGQISAQYGYFTASTPVKVTNALATSITLTPASATVRVGGGQQFTITATFDDGYTQVINGTAAFVSSAPLVAPATKFDLVYGTTIGTATLSASAYGFTKTAALTVLSNVLSSVTLTPTNPSVTSGSTLQLTATGVYNDNSTDNLSSAVQWTSSAPALLSVSSSGVATAAAGITSPTNITVTATAPATADYPAITSSFTVTIQPSNGGGTTTPPNSLAVTPTSTHLAVGTVKQLKALGTYTTGTKDISPSVTWTSTNPSVATVSSTGLVSAVKSGSASVQAAIGSVTSSSIVIVSTATLQSLAISPSGANFASGTTQQFTLTGTYSDGTTQDVSSLATWNTSNANVAKVSDTGLATATGTGSVQFIASFDGMTVTSAVNTVTPATLVSIALTPSSTSFAKGTTQQFKVIGTYSDGSTRDLTSAASYFTSDANVISISATGLATGAGTGSGQITVTVGGQTASTQKVTVTPATLSSITVTPKDASFANGTTQKFTVTGTFSDGTTEDLTKQAVWSSSNPQALTVDENGVATGGSVGSGQITANFNGVSASTNPVNVTSATLQSLSLSPTTAQIAKNSTQQFTVTGHFSDGTTQDLSSTVAWSTSDGTVVSIDSNGLATGNGSGSAQLTATYLGMSVSTSSFTVSSATLDSISFNPAQPSLASGTSSKVMVIGHYSDGTTQDITSTATFTSSNTSIATVSSDGTIHGGTPGTATITVAAQGQTSSFPVTISAATLTSIAITPANPPAFAKGTTQQFTATGTYSDGSTQNLSSSVTWTSSNTSVFTIDANGLATGVGVGSASLTATSGSQTTTTSTFQVTPATVASIVVTPQNPSVAAGGTQQFTATATYTDSTTGNISSTATWTSSDTTIATINTSGLATAVAQGTSTITAQFNGKSGTATFTVTPAVPTLQTITISPSSASIAKSATQQFTAFGTYSDGSVQNLTTQVTWQSSVPAVATIVSTTGVATGVNGGNTQISAALSGKTAVVTLTVSPATLNSIAVTPQTASIANGTTQQYKAVGTLSDGSTQDLTTSVTWSTSNTMAATINSSGLATAASTGTVTITATAGSVTNSATLTITTATLSSLQITPSPVSLSSGTTQQLLATATFSDGSSQNVTSAVNYLSSNSSVVTVNSSGNVKAVAPGSATITGTLQGVSATVSVTIGAATITSIAITPSNPSIAAGNSQQLTATATYSDGSTQNISSTVTWSSSNTAVATVSSTGNATTAQQGNTTITATYGSASGSTTLTATAAVPTAISISPANATLAAGQTQQFAATATLSDGTQQTVTTSVHWGVSDPSKATISDSGSSKGLLTASAAGNLNVTASLNGVTGTAAVTVTAATLSSLTINPSAVIMLPAGTTKQLSVTGTYSDGSTADVTSIVTWSSSQASTAYVDATGLLHAPASGTTTIDAVLSGVTGTAVVMVGNATLTSITISPTNPTIALGQTQQFTATGHYSDLSTADISTQVQWNSSVPSVATINSTGLATSHAAGGSTINASLNGTSTSTALTVTSATLQSIAVQSNSTSFALGTSLQLKALGFYSDGSTQDLTASTTWSSSAPSVGVVSSSGLATGVSTGTFNARATSNGVTGTQAITVTNATLVSIAVTPANKIIVNVMGTTVQYTATGTFTDGSTQNLTTSVHWATSGAVIGGISSTGVFTPTGVGSGTITATSGNVSGSTPFTVVSAPLL